MPVLVGLRSAGGDAARTFMAAAIVLGIIVVVGWPALSQLPWWQAGAAVLVSLVGGPLLAIAIFAALINVVMLPFVLRERARRRRLETFIAAVTGRASPPEREVRRAGERLLEVEHGRLWKPFEEREELLAAADRPGPYQVLLLRLILHHAFRSEAFERLMARHRSTLEAEALSEEDRSRLGWWADAGATGAEEAEDDLR